MNGSSAQRSSLFENVKWAQVVALLNVLGSSELADEWHVRRRYEDFAVGYVETVALLRALKLVEQDRDAITSNISTSSAEDWRRDVIESLVCLETQYRHEVFRYLQTYRILNGEVVREAISTDGLHDSACRNFLMDLAVVKHRPEDGKYVIDPAYITLYAASRQARKGFSAARIQRSVQKKTAIGNAAEFAVVEWEKERVGPALAGRVHHVAPQNALAGYDVTSVTAESTQVRPRYIEVKAVSRHTFQFYWTENEIDVATILGDLYYLYLVPVGSAGEIIVSEVKMISNPCHNVLASEAWEVEANVRCCRPIQGLD